MTASLGRGRKLDDLKCNREFKLACARGLIWMSGNDSYADNLWYVSATNIINPTNFLRRRQANYRSSQYRLRASLHAPPQAAAINGVRS